MSKKDVFRFAVGSPDNVESWIWRFWITKNDVYIGAKDLMQVFKVSLHSSNIWRIAFVEELDRENPSTDRLIKRWNRPDEFTEGWTVSIAILISSIKPNEPLNLRDISDSRINWVAPPTKNKKLLFKVLFSRASNENDIRNVLLPEDQILTQKKKKNGEIVWLILRYSDLEKVEISKITNVIEKTRIHMKPNSSEESILGTRALLVVSEEIPSIAMQPTLIDIPLGKENLDIPKE